MEQKQVPKTTAESTRWSFKIFQDWVRDFNDRNTAADQCPDYVLSSSCSKEELNKWLTLFVVEVRNQNGDPYPPRTLYSILSGISRYMRSENPDYPNFMCKTDSAFNSFRTALDNVCKQLSGDGIEVDASHTEGISAEEEKILCSGVLNTTTPLGLLRAVFDGIGKCFCLRGGQEHRDLTLSHFKRLENPDRYVHCEHISKNHPGGLNLMKLDHKSVTIIANREVGEKCLVYLLDKYISKLPPKRDDLDCFYYRSFSRIPSDDNAPWYMSSTVGKNISYTMVKTMCAEAEIKGKKTNHSLRVAGVSCLFDAGVPEKIIQQRSGHRSIDGLRVYERITDEQDSAVSKILTDSESTNFDVTLAQCTSDVKPPPPDASNTEPKPACSEAPPSFGTHQYNNCQVNVYSAPAFSPYGFQPPWNPGPATNYSNWPQD